ncbi:hypothetical protein M9H77_29774 [Catharanthus roseus]|uniref:Uncharacterized protein n=1 Tax=Catharanthus roseus TaxID=4058 RepID=A0ACB9ZVD3_CATRO|nr:hypothetical protein M9H77_29774 [Catharanthus roseus]
MRPFSWNGPRQINTANSNGRHQQAHDHELWIRPMEIESASGGVYKLQKKTSRSRQKKKLRSSTKREAARSRICRKFQKFLRQKIPEEAEAEIRQKPAEIWTAAAENSGQQKKIPAAEVMQKNSNFG